MDAVITKLTEIEEAALAITAHAEEQKAKLDKEYEDRRREFDKKLDEQTKEKLSKIQEKLDKETDELLNGEAGSGKDAVAVMQEEYETKHTLYAQEILKRITEV